MLISDLSQYNTAFDIEILNFIEVFRINLD